MSYLKPIISVVTVLVFCIIVGWFILEPVQPLPSVDATNARFSPVDQLKSMPYGEQFSQLYALSRIKPAKTLRLIDELKEQVDIESVPIYFAFYLRAQANVWLAKGNLTQSLTFSRQLLEFGKQKQLLWIEATALHDLSVGLVKKGDLEKAKQLLDQAVTISKGLNYQVLLMSIYNVLGVINNIEGNKTVAQNYFHRGLDIAKHYPKHRIRSSIIGNLSILYTELGDWDKALEYTDRAIRIYKKSTANAPNTVAIHLLNRALISINTDKFDVAKQALLDVSSVTQSAYPTRIQLLHSFVHARLLLAQDTPKLARQVIAQCIHHPKGAQYAIEFGQCIELKAKIELAIGDYAQSKQDLLHALEIFEGIPSEVDFVNTLESLSLIYEKLGDFETAYRYLKQYDLRYSAYLAHQRSNRFERQEEAYKLRQHKNEIALLKAEKSLSDLKSSQEEVRLKLISALASVVIAAFLYQVYQLRSINRHNQSLRSSNKVLEKEALQDTLTGLYNRRYIENLLSELRGNQKSQCTSFYTIGILDLDNFKSINDTYGHAAGDSILQEASFRFNREMGSRDVFVRWGGEEFLCLVEHHCDEPAMDILERLCDTIRSTPFHNGTGNINVSVSIGAITDISREELLNNWENYIALADEQLYLAKAQGRDRYRLTNARDRGNSL